MRFSFSFHFSTHHTVWTNIKHIIGTGRSSVATSQARPKKFSAGIVISAGRRRRRAPSSVNVTTPLKFQKHIPEFTIKTSTIHPP